MALTVQAIDRFIGQGNPIAQAGGAQMLLRATGGNLTGAAFLAALARKESEFGRTSGRFRNNAWGWGVHLGPSVNTAGSWEEMAKRVWRGLSSGGLYREQGIVTPAAIIQKYAPPSENDTGLYQRQVQGWFRELGLNPNANVFSGKVVPVPGGPIGAAAQQNGVPRQQFTQPMTSVNAQPAAPPPLVLSPRLQRQIQDYLVASRAQVEAGIEPTSPMHIVQGIAKAQQKARLAATQFEAPTPQVMSLQRGALPAGHYPGDGHDHGEGQPAVNVATGPLTLPASSFPAGPVDSGKVVKGGEGGNWGGSLERALFVARASGLPITSQKRSRQRTASGGVSDHWVGSTRSYAVDLGTSGAAGDAAYVKMLQGMGLDPRRFPSGRWHNVNIGGYRYQIGWRTPGHFDHIHVGVQRA